MFFLAGFFIFLLFFSSFLRQFFLVSAFIALFFSLFLTFNSSTMTTFFDYYVVVIKLEVFNFIYALSFDFISLWFLILSFILFIVCILIVWNLKYKIKDFLIMLFFINFFLFNVFCVVDLFFFYVYFESLLIPMFFLIGVWGSRDRKISAAYQFFLYTLFGSIFMLISIFFVYSHYGTTDFRLFFYFSLTFERQMLFWIFFFIAIAVKVPMFPVHIWLPEAHVEAPTAGSVILAGVLLKLGLFALFKFLFPLFPASSVIFTPVVFVLSLLGVIYASCSTLSQIDMKKMVAYSSVAHMNFAILGMFSFNFYGFIGGISLMLAHGFVSSGLFLSVGSLYDRYKTRLFLYYGGLIRLMPFFSFFFFLFILSNMGFPGSFNFIGEILIFFGLVFSNLFICLLAGSTMVFSAAYSLALYTHIVLGQLNPIFVKYFSDLGRREFYMFFVLAVFTVFFGIFPNFILVPIEGNAPVYLDLILSFFFYG